MTPKIIHYCWFGKNPLPPLAQKCIVSWKKYMPEYKIKEWNEENFDVNMIPYIKEAYEAKKYAFVSDYARFWILYHYGGIYFDTDVEVIRPLNDIIDKGAFMGCESKAKTNIPPSVNPGLGLGCNPGLGLMKEMIELYATLSFKTSVNSLNLKTIVEYTTEILLIKGLKNTNEIQKVDEFYIYPSEYFCPINIITKRIHITKETYTIHHYLGSWSTNNKKKRIKKRLQKLLPEWLLLYYNKIKNK